MNELKSKLYTLEIGKNVNESVKVEEPIKIENKSSEVNDKIEKLTKEMDVMKDEIKTIETSQIKNIEGGSSRYKDMENNIYTLYCYLYLRDRMNENVTLSAKIKHDKMVISVKKCKSTQCKTNYYNLGEEVNFK